MKTDEDEGYAHSPYIATVRVAALDEPEGGPLRAKVEAWKKGREELLSFGVRTKFKKVTLNHSFFAKVEVDDL